MKKIILKHGIKEIWPGLKKVLLVWLIPSFIGIILIFGHESGNYIGAIKYYFLLLIIATSLRLGLQKVYFFEDYFLDVAFSLFKRKLFVKNVLSVKIDWDDIKIDQLTLEIISSHNKKENISIQNSNKEMRTFAIELKEKFPDLPYDESFEKLVNSTDEQLVSYASTKGISKVMFPTFIKWFSKK